MIYLYGTTPKGHKIHVGTTVSGQRVWTFCGCDMVEWKESERPPGNRADEFCKRCFFTTAWASMDFLLQTSPAALAFVPNHPGEVRPFKIEIHDSHTQGRSHLRSVH